MATESMQRIWQVVKLIPVGRVATYGQVADLAGLPGRARLTSKALGAAPKAMQLPWYRVLRSDGKIAFDKHSDFALRQRDALLAEDIMVTNFRVKLDQFQWQPALTTLLYELDF
ncbi:MGMT family protein [Alteromonas flava]|uniref:MGMT family protein n=1 Tax=Alteromonas flava TaxID=2048003 RepID=UPI000C286B2F|nr:MGMT family protein [Alteromonas flava]